MDTNFNIAITIQKWSTANILSTSDCKVLQLSGQQAQVALVV